MRENGIGVDDSRSAQTAAVQLCREEMRWTSKERQQEEINEAQSKYCQCTGRVHLPQRQPIHGVRVRVVPAIRPVPVVRVRTGLVRSQADTKQRHESEGRGHRRDGHHGIGMIQAHLKQQHQSEG